MICTRRNDGVEVSYKNYKVKNLKNKTHTYKAVGKFQSVSIRRSKKRLPASRRTQFESPYQNTCSNYVASVHFGRKQTLQKSAKLAEWEVYVSTANHEKKSLRCFERA